MTEKFIGIQLGSHGVFDEGAGQLTRHVRRVTIRALRRLGF